MDIILEIGGHKLKVLLGDYHPRVKGDYYEPDEEAFYDIDDVIMLSDESKTYEEIEEILGTDDLWFDIQDAIEEYEKIYWVNDTMY